VNKPVEKPWISKRYFIWKKERSWTIFDLQLHGILAIKFSAGETEALQKVEVSPLKNGSPSKGGNFSRKHQVSYGRRKPEIYRLGAFIFYRCGRESRRQDRT
jgi:hypothetical protein